MSQQRDLFDQVATANCERCRRPCRPAPDGNPDSRLLRRATSGLCVDCAVTQFLKGTEPIATVLRIKGAVTLLDPAVRAQFAAVMRAGFADAREGEIDWRRVVANWELEMPGRKRR